MKRYLYFSLLILIALSSCSTGMVATAPYSDVVIIEKLPKYHRVIINKGTKYYYWNGKYHKKHRRGYVTVRYRGI